MPEGSNTEGGAFRASFPEYIYELGPESDLSYLSREDRSNAELEQVLEQREARKISTDVFDEHGQKLAKVEYDPKTGDVLAVFPERFVNVEGKAENPNETVYVTDENGRITDERLTRAEAPAQKKRKLVVTTLLFQEDPSEQRLSMLVQKRSSKKEIDPGQVSASAHGVAKEIFSQSQRRIDDGQTAALINASLELNEELRHDAEPFHVHVWPGNHRELLLYSEEKKWNDPNTVWMITEGYLGDSGYPLGRFTNPRTRAILAGFIFTKEPFNVSVDPGELEGASWKKPEDVRHDPEATEDVAKAILQFRTQFAKDMPVVRRYGPVLLQNTIRRWR